MKAVVTRVRSASVVVDDSVVGSIPDSDVGGLLVLIGVATGDTSATARAMAEKLARLRIFEGSTSEGRPTEVSALDLDAPILVVSQFTLMGDTSHGRRPSWSAAAKPAEAEPIFNTCVEGASRPWAERRYGRVRRLYGRRVGQRWPVHRPRRYSVWRSLIVGKSPWKPSHAGNPE